MTRHATLVGFAAVSVLSAGVVSAVGAHADAPPGSGLLGYTLTSQATGFQLVEDQPKATTHPEADGEVPDSQVSMTSGPVGYALSSIAWPGSLAGNAGSLLVVAGAPLPPSTASQLNDPVRAETRTGGPRTVTNSSVPGVTMSATVTPGRAQAESVVDGGSTGQTAGFGTTSTSAVADLLAAAATSTSDSTTKDVSVASGALTIDSVVSHAQVTTDGVAPTGRGATTVSGLRIGGVPVTVDDHGVTVAGTSSPVDPTASETVNTVLANLGMHVVLSSPTFAHQAGTGSYDAGSLIVTWTPPGSSNHITVLLGGARVLASANLGSPLALLPSTVPTIPASAAPPPVTGAAAPAVAPVTAVPPISSVSAPQAAAPAAPAVVAAASVVSEVPASASAVLLASLGALLLLGAMLRLPATVLTPAGGSACPKRRFP